MTTAVPDLDAQIDRLTDTGLLTAAGLPADEVRRRTAAVGVDGPALLAVHPRLLPASTLAAALVWQGKPAFVVTDMPDLDEFAPTPEAGLPDADLWLVSGLDRGDDLANWSPEEAQPELLGRGRRPLTVNEGVGWVLAEPTVLERNRCFMAIGSRRPRPGRSGPYDARTPAVWISNGTGRDGAERRGAAKVGWCWWRNRHTWLGFASAEARHPVA